MLFFITGVGLVLFLVAMAALIIIVRSGQMDDLDTPPQRMLGEDAPGAGRPLPEPGPRTKP
ncbi:MAG: cbb3-type cytochrome oxidase assembly protein [Planctomycetota bacterium]